MNWTDLAYLWWKRGFRHDNEPARTITGSWHWRSWMELLACQNVFLEKKKGCSNDKGGKLSRQTNATKPTGEWVRCQWRTVYTDPHSPDRSTSRVDGVETPVWVLHDGVGALLKCNFMTVNSFSLVTKQWVTISIDSGVDYKLAAEV